MVDEKLMAELLLASLMLIAALLYSAVGHGGASGYLAAMSLFNIPPSVMKPSALILNIIVATIATVKFYRAGSFNPSLFFPLAICSIPCAFVGGILTLPDHIYKPVIGLFLLYAAARLIQHNPDPRAPARETHIAPLRVKFALGGSIGLLSGLTGVGGGIFLSPLLLLMGWATAKETAGVSAAFILVNSIAGLSGHLTKFPSLRPTIFLWGIAVAIGGWLGAEYGTKKLKTRQWQQILAVVLVIAGVKMLLK